MTSNKEFCRFLSHGLYIHYDGTCIGPCCLNVQHNTNITDAGNFSDSKRCEDMCGIQEQYNKSSYRIASFDMIDDNACGITSLEVTPTIKCNLACVMCGSHSSSTWYKENKKFNYLQSAEIEKLHNINENANLFYILSQIDLSNLTYLKIRGGEPFYNDMHYKILKQLPNPENITVQYVSNFSIEPSQEVIDRWKKFKLIKWVASIDDVGHRFEYLRWPYKWKKIQKFKNKMIKTMPPNVMFGIETTITPLNIYYINDILDWAKNKFSHNAYGDKIELSTHFAGGILGINKIPESLFNEVKHRIDRQLFETLSAQKSNDFVSDNSELIIFLDRLTNERNMDWRKIFPEIQHHFK